MVVARPPTSDFAIRPSAAQRRANRDAQRDTVIDTVHAHNPDAVIVVGPTFGHTRPQWMVPYGGPMTDGASHRLSAHYS